MTTKLTVKFKKVEGVENAVIPSKANQSDAAFDLTATSVEEITTPSKNGAILVKFGLCVELPPNTVGLLFPRSSVWKTSNRLSNHVGVIDSGYRGEIMAVFDTQNLGLPRFSIPSFLPAPHPTPDSEHIYKVGERCAQLIILPLPQVEIVEVDELSESDRGSGGFGSSGN